MFYLRDIRKKNNLTMKELGEKVGLTESAIGLYETEKRKPNYEMLLKLSEALDCTVNDLLYGYGSDEIADEISDFGGFIVERDSPEGKLFQTLKGASKEEIEQAVKIIEALRK